MAAAGVTRQQLILGSNKPSNAGNLNRIASNSSCGEMTKQVSQQYVLCFEFNKLAYQGKYGLSLKAVNIKLTEVKSLA